MSAPPPKLDRFTWRFRLVACCLVLVAVSFSQRPGRIVGDTKLDLVLNPAGLLTRSLHLWDPQGGFGQVQNQAYGYLFPMGPFFWMGHLASVPAWIVQRTWWSLLLVVAFLGVVKLAGALGLGSPTSRVVAGFAYALSPRILTTLGPISIEAWPSALAPWVLVPLVIGANRGSPRRAALLSALAVAAVGGVNAAATFAVIPLGVVWLLTRQSGPRRRSLMVWWPVFVLVGTAWWLVPLFILGRYSPPFLDYIETARVTTFPTTIFDALRGTSHWVPYVDPTWQAGNDLITTGYVALNSGALLLFGVAGLTMRRNPHRQFLVLSVFVGLLMVTAGHGGQVAGWFAGTERDLLDGVLAPLRNVHKFDPVIRIPLVLGLAHLLAVLADRVRSATRARGDRSDAVGNQLTYAGVLLLTITSVAGVAAPAFAGRLGAANDFAAVPGYWYRAAAWLDQNGDDTTALLVPGSSFGFYVWGDPDDEPMQPLADSPWAVRNAVPLAPAGNIRMLDAIEDQLASGRPSAGLASYLSRAGIGHLVVRNDLRGADQTAPVQVHQVLDGSPGIRRVAHFGPKVGGPVRIGGRRDPTIVDDGWVHRYPALEVYEVDGAHRAVAASSSPVVVGGPEDLLGLLDTGLISDAPSELAVDAPDDVDTSDLLLTDGLRRQERNFARILQGSSATLTEDDDGRRGAPARDYTLGDGRWETHAKILGARDVTASSSRAFADSSDPVLPEYQPFSAFDGLNDTQWESDPNDDAEPWIGVELDAPREIRTVDVVLGDTGSDQAERIRVETAAGSSSDVVARPGQPVTIPLPAGSTSSLRVVRTGLVDGPLAIAEIQIPGVDVDRTLVLPRVPADWGAPASILLSSTSGWRDPCVRVDGDVRCAADRAAAGEEPGALDRTLRLGTSGSYRVSTTATPADGDALQGLLQRGQLVNARASSQAVDDARASAVAAIDGDDGTTWVADADDDDPTLSLSWLGARRIRGVQLSLDRLAPASRATRVVLDYPGGSQTVDLDRTGHAQVRPFRATRVDLHLEAGKVTDDLQPDGGRVPLGVGVGEVRLSGLGLLPVTLSDQPTDLGCEYGPVLRVGSSLYPTSVTASPRELFDGGLLPARVCGASEVEIPAHDTRVVLAPAPAFRGVQVVMTRRTPPPAVVSPADLSDSSPVSRVLTIPSPGASIAAVRENQNPGWTASTPDDGSVSSVTVDGWQQGWRLTGSVQQVDLTFTPDRLYRGALLVGAILLGLLGAAALVRSRPVELPPPVAARRLHPLAVGGFGLLTLGALGGWWAFVTGTVAMVVTVVVGHRVGRDVAAWVSGLLPAVAALFYWWRPLGSADGWAGGLVAPQLLVVAGLGVLLGLVLDPRGSKRPFQRITGRSTVR